MTKINNLIFNVCLQASLIENTVGNYEEAEALKDIEEMIRLFASLEGDQGFMEVMKEIKNNQELLQWTTRLAFFIQKMSKSNNPDVIMYVHKTILDVP